MGLYGSPDLQEPPNVRPEIHTCKYCHNSFVGRFCPFCGTERGKKNPRLTYKKWLYFLLGVLLEGGLTIAIIYMNR